MNTNPKITDAELDIMQVVWDSPRPITFREICTALQSSAKKVTIQTLISRLVEKGVLLQDKQEVYYYSTLVSREAFEQAKTEELIQKVYRGDVRKLFAALMDSKAIPQEDIDELQNFWKETNHDA